MSFYRSVLAAVAAIAFVAPVFADDTTTTTGTTGTTTEQTATTGDAATTTTTTTTTEAKVDVNKATAKELMKVKGISSSRAKSIISYRKKNGDFKSLDDLTKVSGFKNINTKTLQSIQDQLSVE